MCYLNVPRYDVPELITEADDSKEALDIINEVNGLKNTNFFINLRYC